MTAAQRYPQLADRQWLMNRYWHDRATIEEIAASLGCSSSTVVRALQRHGVPARRPGRR